MHPAFLHVHDLVGPVRGGVELEACIAARIAQGARFLVFDCRRLESIDHDGVAALGAHYLRLLFAGGNIVFVGLAQNLGLPIQRAENLEEAFHLCQPVEGLLEPELNEDLLVLDCFLKSTEVAIVRLTGGLFGQQACERLHLECAPLAGRHLMLDCLQLVSLQQQATLPLTRLAQAAWEYQRRVALVGLHPHPSRVLAHMRLDRYFQFYGSVEEALTALE